MKYRWAFYIRDWNFLFCSITNVIHEIFSFSVCVNLSLTLQLCLLFNHTILFVSRALPSYANINIYFSSLQNKKKILRPWTCNLPPNWVQIDFNAFSSFTLIENERKRVVAASENYHPLNLFFSLRDAIFISQSSALLQPHHTWRQQDFLHIL